MDLLHVTSAEALLADVARLKPAAVLSIEHPGHVIGDKAFSPRLAEHGCAADFQKIMVYWDTENEHPEGPSEALVREGLNYMLAAAKRGNIIVNCARGRSRSVAMALGFIAATWPHQTPEDWIARLKYIRRIHDLNDGFFALAPNSLMVKILDKILNLNGILYQAVLDDPELTEGRARANAARARHAEKNPTVFKI